MCGQCGKQWPEGYAVCPDDGVRLSVIGVTAAASTGALALARQVADDELPAGSMAGEYQIERKLGQGGMGAVYGAKHPLIGKRAAIKVIKRELSSNAEAVERFVREAQAVNQIGHPNIVDVFGFGTLADGRSFFVMEWLQGETLRARMERTLALPDALEILEQMALALEAAHDAGVLHRDLKPDNVYLVNQKGGPAKVKLLDFGLAKLQGSGESPIGQTRTGVVMGTPLYLSPEQAKGVKVDLAADIYSLGAIAYEMCSGQVPFTADSAVEIMAKHISERPVPLFEIAPHTPPALDQLVLAMLGKDPKGRPPIAHVRLQIAMIRARLSVAATQPPRESVTPISVMAAPAVAQPQRSKRGLVIGAVAATAVALGAGGILLFGGGEKQKPAKTEVVAAEPPVVKSEPVKVKEEPKSEPVKVEPVKAEPVKEEPAKPEPAKVAPKAAPPPAKTEKPGSITIKLDGAARGKIWVDKKVVSIGQAETTIELPPGAHHIHAQSPGHLPANESITVTPGMKTTVHLKLEKSDHSVLGWDDN